MQARIINDRHACPGLQFHCQRFKRQANHIGVRPRNAFDDLIPIFLNSVTASLIERIHPRQIAADLNSVQRPKSDRCALAKNPLSMVAPEASGKWP